MRRRQRLALRAAQQIIDGTARLPRVGGRLVLEVCLTPPPSRPRLSAAHTALWASRSVHATRALGYRCPVASWEPAGPIRGRAAVFHGWGTDARCLLGVVADLLGRGFAVWAPDAPGHGQGGGRQSDLQRFTAAVHATLRVSGPVDVLIGHSLGAAAIAWALNGYLGLGPAHAARRLVLLSSPNQQRSYADTFIRMLQLSERTRQELYQAFDRRYGHADRYCTVGELLSLRPIPTLLLHDQDDPFIPIAQLDGIVASLASHPSLTVHRTAGLKHSRALRDPETIQRIGAFAQGYSSPHPSERSKPSTPGSAIR